MNREQPMSFGDWMVTFLITAIPLVNVIAIIVWASSSSTNLNKQNYARAALVWFAIGVVLYLVFAASIGGALFFSGRSG